MNSDETAQLLKGKDRKEIDSSIVSWQRQILESLGIEQVSYNFLYVVEMIRDLCGQHFKELGCFALQYGAMVKFTDDEEYMRSMRQFYVSCSMVAKKAETPANSK